MLDRFSREVCCCYPDLINKLVYRRNIAIECTRTSLALANQGGFIEDVENRLKVSQKLSIQGRKLVFGDAFGASLRDVICAELFNTLAAVEEAVDREVLAVPTRCVVLYKLEGLS